MKRGQRPSADQAVLMLRQIEVQTAQGKSNRGRPQGGGNLRAELRNECLRQEICHSLEAQTVSGLWQNTYNCVRPRSSLGDLPSAPGTVPVLALRLPMAAQGCHHSVASN